VVPLGAEPSSARRTGFRKRPGNSSCASIVGTRFPISIDYALRTLMTDRRWQGGLIVVRGRPQRTVEQIIGHGASCAEDPSYTCQPWTWTPISPSAKYRAHSDSGRPFELSGLAFARMHPLWCHARRLATLRFGPFR